MPRDGPVTESQPVQGGHRARVLRALGLTAYRLRDRSAAAVLPPAVEIPASAGAPSALACVVLLPAATAARQLDLVGRALKAFGAQFARAPRIAVADGLPAQPVPAAHVYLTFGQAQAQALGRSVPAAQVDAAQVLLLDEPAQLQAADGKRQLWQAFKRARQALKAVARQARE